ncbi:MAG: QueT transporter family protein [Solobacterium sp.]|nr:QueT transporter family protein [Solobacterium sp.]MBR0213391.1 QueT transporter family protein [Solobacterium sp.]
MNTKKMVRIAMIAAIYTALSLALAPFSYGNIQVRIAEALTLLPLIYQPAIWGVTLGCFLTNLIGAIMGFNPTGMIDAVIGTAATLLAALCTYKFRDRKVGNIPVLSILMPVIFNFFFIGAELGYLFFPDNLIMGSLICGAEVAVGELISVTVGWFVINWLGKTKLFKS